MVKRVVATAGNRVPEDFRHAVEALDPDTMVPSGFLLVRGDNPRSLDSRHFGYVSTADLLGVALRRRPHAP
jgi:signal peptidase I